MRSYQWMAALAGVLCTGAVASADYVHFATRAAFEASVAGVQTSTDYSGESIAPGSYTYWSDSYTNNGVTFSLTGSNILLADTGYSDYGQRTIVWNDGLSMLAYVPEGVTALGVDMYSHPDYAKDVLCTAWFNDGTSSSVLLPSQGKSTPTFFGIEVNDGRTITHLTSYATSFGQEGGAHATAPTWDYGAPGIGTITYAIVPEPSSIVVLGCGLTGLLAYAFRKRK